jgi:hypothetical protein
MKIINVKMLAVAQTQRFHPAVSYLTRFYLKNLIAPQLVGTSRFSLSCSKVWTHTRKRHVIWDTTPCIPFNVNRRFGEIYPLYLLCFAWIFSHFEDWGDMFLCETNVLSFEGLHDIYGSIAHVLFLYGCETPQRTKNLRGVWEQRADANSWS